MNLHTALSVEYKRREAEAEVAAALVAATQAEEATLDSTETGDEKVLSRARFMSLGKRIIAMADSEETTPEEAGHTRVHTSFTEIGVEGLAIVAKAREGIAVGSLRGWELSYLEVEWLSSAYVSDAPLAREQISLSEAHSNLTPEVAGALRLIEQSVEIAELARQGSPAA